MYKASPYTYMTCIYSHKTSIEIKKPSNDLGPRQAQQDFGEELVLHEAVDLLLNLQESLDDS